MKIEFNVRESFNKLIKLDIAQIVSSELCLELLKCYSILYLGGIAPSFCEICIRGYFTELKKTGEMRIINYEKIKSRTLIPNWCGLKYIPAESDHFNSEMLTDETAGILLFKGSLQESDFKKLPDSYITFKNSKEKKEGELQPRRIKKNKK